MAAPALGLDGVWLARPVRPWWQRVPLALTSFARKKPLGFFGLVVIIGLVLIAIPPVADAIAPYSYSQQSLRERLQAPSAQHWMGTDQNGRDVFSRIVYGARVAVVVGFGAVFLTEILAVSIGLVSGYYLGWFDRIFQRLVDVFQALPNLVILITILGILGSGMWPMVLVIGLLGGPGASRLIRGQVISISNMPYVESARVIGAGHLRIMTVHILRNVVALVILGATLRIGAVILAEATLSFLGYGVPPPYPSWGQMLALDGREFMRKAPWLAIFPGLAIAITVYAFNVFGDALRDVLDPRLRGRG